MRRSMLFSAAILSVAPAQAATVIQTFNFVASDFVSMNSVAAPTDPVVGSFTVEFDPDVGGYWDSTTGLTVNYLNIPYISGAGFSDGFTPNGLVIGGLSAGVTGMSMANMDFRFLIEDISRPNVGASFSYSSGLSNGTSGEHTYFEARSVQVNAVPEPSTWAMLILGFAAIGGAMRSRKRHRLGVRFAL